MYYVWLVGNCLENNTDYFGGDFNGSCANQPTSWRRDTPVECQLLCQEVFGCGSFTWIDINTPLWEKDRKRCCLKRKHQRTQYVKGVVSGPSTCGTTVSKNEP